MKKYLIPLHFMKWLFVLFFLYPLTGHSLSSEEDYVVLLRGCHFSANYFIDLEDQKNLEFQTVRSPYMSSIRGSDVIKSQKIRTFLEDLRRDGPYKSLKKPGKIYDSPYHWLQEKYINHYGEFIKDTKNPSSELRRLMKEHHVEFEGNIFVSTTLDCETAVKYALGICLTKEHRNWPDWLSEAGLHPEENLGYVDVFFIKRSDLERLGAFSVVEEFIAHGIDIKHSDFRQNDYTPAFEYNFPLEIPMAYHKKRIPISIGKTIEEELSREDINIASRLKRQVSNQQKKIEKIIAGLTQKHVGKRVFLSLLYNRLDKGEERLTSESARKIHRKAEEHIGRVRSDLASQGVSFFEKLTLPQVIAFERNFIEGEEEFIFRCSKAKFNNIHNIAALARINNLTRVIIGEDKSDEGIFIDCLGVGRDISDMEILTQIASKRTQPLIFKMNFQVSPEDIDTLRRISQKTGQKIQFKFNRHIQKINQKTKDWNYHAANCEEAKRYYNPLRFTLEKMLRKYVAYGEKIHKKISQTCEKKLKKILIDFSDKDVDIFPYFSIEDFDFGEEELDFVDNFTTLEKALSGLREGVDSRVSKLEENAEEFDCEFEDTLSETVKNKIKKLFEEAKDHLEGSITKYIDVLESKYSGIEELVESDLEEDGFSSNPESDLEDEEQKTYSNVSSLQDFARKRKSPSSEEESNSSESESDLSYQESYDGASQKRSRKNDADWGWN